ncbi:ABC transporter ATP-binding protein [Adlercreutzia sp. ZJ141]|uniref:ABC transporter ATP-binding protein n=1 Tax=Adlercreutzia sp. ZJ141 TaxID=2709406 RepID=UPI0013EA4634|nr:ABC transporter ATP-binding protein [Adlercreutzia sp. ZJ141]
MTNAERNVLEHKAKETDSATMVKVDHVTMAFNIASEQLNNLKEYAIAIARRELVFKEFLALQDISFEVKKGDVFGILGTNGSGKSTMMKIIAGVLEPTHGACTVNGSIAPLIELGAGFDMDLTARENIYLNGALLGYSRKFIRQHFDEIVDFAEIGDFLDMPLKNYSSGMIARIAFAIATVIVPEILLVDEVLSVGDFMFQKKCEKRIEELITKHNVTVLVVSHDNNQISRLCNKAIWIEKGHTRIQGDSQQVCLAYGALGGRKGSSESEVFLFNLLISSLNNQQHAAHLITESDPCEIPTLLLASRGTSPEKPEDDNSVVIALASTHINSIYANSLCSNPCTPVFQTRADSLPISVKNYIERIKPNSITFVSCGQSTNSIIRYCSNLDWKPEVIDLSGSGYFPLYSMEIIKYGLKKNLWDSTLVVIDFESQAEALAFSPYLARDHCPVMVVKGEVGKNELLDLLDNDPKEELSQIIAVGPLHPSIVRICKDHLPTKMIGTSDDSLWKRCISISQWACETAEKPFEVYILSIDSSQWLHAFSIASCSHTERTVVLFEDLTNLDSMAACVDFIKEHISDIHALHFVGSENSFSIDDYSLLDCIFHNLKSME